MIKHILAVVMLLVGSASAQWLGQARQTSVLTNSLGAITGPRSNVQQVVEWVGANWLTNLSLSVAYASQSFVSNNFLSVTNVFMPISGGTNYLSTTNRFVDSVAYSNTISGITSSVATINNTITGVPNVYVSITNINHQITDINTPYWASIRRGPGPTTQETTLTGECVAGSANLTSGWNSVSYALNLTNPGLYQVTVSADCVDSYIYLSRQTDDDNNGLWNTNENLFIGRVDTGNATNQTISGTRFIKYTGVIPTRISVSRVNTAGASKQGYQEWYMNVFRLGDAD